MHNDLKTLKEITYPIFEDIKIFEDELRDALKSEVRLVNTVGKYIATLKTFLYWATEREYNFNTNFTKFKVNLFKCDGYFLPFLELFKVCF